MSTVTTLDDIRAGQVGASAIRGSLLYGFTFEGLPTAAALFEMDRLARERSLSFVYGRGDAENADDGSLVESTWIVGASLFAVSGGWEQERGFTFAELAAATAEAKGRVDEAKAVFADACAKYTSKCLRDAAPVVPTTPELLLAASGGLALVTLLHGAWAAPPARTDPDEDDGEDEDAQEEARQAWFDTCRATPATANAVGFRYGTEGSTQTSYPGAVRGLMIEGADQGYESVTLDAASDAARSGTLAAAGVASPRYFLVTRYD